MMLVTALYITFGICGYLVNINSLVKIFCFTENILHFCNIKNFARKNLIKNKVFYRKNTGCFRKIDEISSTINLTNYCSNVLKF